MQASNIDHWKQVLKQLVEEEVPKAKERVGKSVEDGDWQENAEFEDASRQLEFVEARVDEVKKLIKTLEKNEREKAFKKD
jgi:transcription elongation GreA/GreB family factor